METREEIKELERLVKTFPLVPIENETQHEQAMNFLKDVSAELEAKAEIYAYCLVLRGLIVAYERRTLPTLD